LLAATSRHLQTPTLIIVYEQGELVEGLGSATPERMIRAPNRLMNPSASRGQGRRTWLMS